MDAVFDTLAPSPQDRLDLIAARRRLAGLYAECSGYLGRVNLGLGTAAMLAADDLQDRATNDERLEVA